VSITVTREPSPLSPGQQTEKELLLARVERLGGNTAGAISRLKALLVREPTNTNVLVGAAALVAEVGQIEEAVVLYDRAIAAAAKSAREGSDPPAELIRAQQVLRARLRAGAQ
jgi:Flp pilus assembly protein TadD